jgi:hypothetical protein
MAHVLLFCLLLPHPETPPLWRCPIGAHITRNAVGLAKRGLRAQAAWRINPHNFQRIEKGMTMAEVVAILGGAPDDYTLFTDPLCCCFRWGGGFYDEGGAFVRAVDEQWNGDAGTVLLRFKRGKVTQRSFLARGGGWLGDDERPMDFFED